MSDVWNGLASFLAEMIEKYGNELNYNTPSIIYEIENVMDPNSQYFTFICYFDKLIANRKPEYKV